MMARTPADVLARTLWAEARSEGVAGMEAVASVILTRAAHPGWWGHDVMGVCLAPQQFSCWNASDPQHDAIRSVTAADPLFREAQAVAAAALAGTLVDRTHGADSYANLADCHPAWAKGRVPCAVIGHHTFFRLRVPAPSGGAGVRPAVVPQPAAVSDDAETDALNAAQLARG